MISMKLCRAELLIHIKDTNATKLDAWIMYTDITECQLGPTHKNPGKGQQLFGVHSV